MMLFLPSKVFVFFIMTHKKVFIKLLHCWDKSGGTLIQAFI
jgi:hypothetical protein